MTIIKRIEGKIKVELNGKWYDVKDYGLMRELAWKSSCTDSNSFESALEQGIEIPSDRINIETIHSNYDYQLGKQNVIEYAVLKTVKEDDNQDELWDEVFDIVKDDDACLYSELVCKLKSQFKITKK